MIKNKRDIELVDVEGRPLVVIHLNKAGDKICSLWKSDYDFLIDDCGLNPNWLTNPDRDNVLATSITSTRVGVARVLLDAKEGEVVKYRDGNPLNLKRENLLLVDAKNGGRRRDRDFIVRSITIDAQSRN